jgi:hypothetical protein
LAHLASWSRKIDDSAGWREFFCAYRYFSSDLRKEFTMWRMWRVIDPRKAIVLTGLMIAFISTSIHLIQISGDRYNINSWHPDTAKAAAARVQPQNAALPQK